jgi:hypothetical protein
MEQAAKRRSQFNKRKESWGACGHDNRPRTKGPLNSNGNCTSAHGPSLSSVTTGECAFRKRQEGTVTILAYCVPSCASIPSLLTSSSHKKHNHLRLFRCGADRASFARRALWASTPIPIHRPTCILSLFRVHESQHSPAASPGSSCFTSFAHRNGTRVKF